MVQYLNINEAQQKFIDLPKKLTEGPIVITQNGKPVMTTMSYEQFESLMETLSIITDESFFQKLESSIIQAQQGNTLTWEDAKIKLGL
jgi:prevent-host-death family protein